MKLAIFSLLINSTWGGSENLWFKTALHALKSNNQVLIILQEPVSFHHNIKLLKDNGAEIFVVKNHLTKFSDRLINKLIKGFSHRKLLKLLEDKLYDFSPNITLINQPGCFDIAYNDLIKDFLLKTKFSYAICSHSYLQNHIVDMENKEVLSILFLKAKKCFFVAGIQHDTIVQQLELILPNTDYIYNTLNINLKTSIPYPSYDNNVQLAMVGSLDIKWKGQDTLIETLSAKEWTERNWELNIYGVGPDFEKINELIKTKNLTDKIFLKGFQANTENIWACNHILLMPSKVDAAPSVMLEAMAYGRTVVTSNIGFVKEWLTDRENGFIAEDIDIASFRIALNEAWSKIDQWKIMGEKCKEKFIQNFPQNPEKLFLDQLTGLMND